MKAIVQRVSEARVRVEGEIVGEIGPGLVALVGVTHDDTPAQATKLADKIANLRIFEDNDEKMNLSALDVSGGVLAVSQFTLYGDTRKGRRPAFVDAARPEVAEPLFDSVVAALRDLGVADVQTGRFRTHMAVELINDGPITLTIEV
jgi:D-tyrosyl-tRNA(Tyr) deacylase